MKSTASYFVLTFLLTCLHTPLAFAQLHRQIDELVEAKAGGVALGKRSDDAEFVRRVYLDLAGRIPSISETKTFLGDDSPNKREKLIDQLLDSPGYARRMRELFHVILMKRRGDDDQWQTFLRAPSSPPAEI